jgi:hypothetical protein
VFFFIFQPDLTKRFDLCLSYCRRQTEVFVASDPRNRALVGENESGALEQEAADVISIIKTGARNVADYTRKAENRFYEQGRTGAGRFL